MSLGINIQCAAFTALTTTLGITNYYRSQYAKDLLANIQQNATTCSAEIAKLYAHCSKEDLEKIASNISSQISHYASGLEWSRSLTSNFSLICLGSAAALVTIIAAKRFCRM